MSLTSNFDYCIELSLDVTKTIFHLAFKNEKLFPHNIGPLQRTFAGHAATVYVTALDDMDRPADLSFQDDKHILFSIPFDVSVSIPDAPDPALAKLTISATAQIPGRLDSWTESGSDVLGITFADVTPDSVTITNLTGLPAIDPAEIARSIHAKYDTLQHTYTLGADVLNLYDGTRDTGLSPPDPGNPPITCAVETPGGGTQEYLKVDAPIWVDVPQALNFTSFGHLDFHRPLTQTDTTITVDMTSEPAQAGLATAVVFDQTGSIADLVAANLKPLAVQAISGFGVITEPAFSTAAATQLLQQEVAAYVQPLRYDVYTPQSGDPTVTLSTPVGFLLAGPGVLAILMNRRSGTAADDSPPDDFLGAAQLALAVGRDKVIERSDDVIAKRFPGVNNGGAEIHTSSGDATLHTCHATPEDDGDHGEHPGHLWVSGDATVHIPCWPDPDVSFEGPVFVDASEVDTDKGCTLKLQPRAGHFDVDESCCSVLLDLLIPVVGWVMLIVVEVMINDVGGQLASSVAAGEGQAVQPFPPVVFSIAEVTACLTGLTISHGGFVFPGKVDIRRLGTSFQDRQSQGGLPGPDNP
ncbi:MAG TPA: hypothetical protein VFO60_08990 [Candidatus Dormibacteraeota bacterium]|nr:hypothetical protein [Candidatus Dormibacteraeota bacterium]